MLFALVILFGWLATRAWHSSRRILKWPGLALSGLLAVLLALVFVVGVLGAYRLYVPRGNPVADVNVSGTPERIARGERFAHYCAGCHSSTGKPPLDGSTTSYAGPLGPLYPPNLTPAGPLKAWSDGEILRAVREGVDKDGRALLVMPSEAFHNLSDVDAIAIVAYLRSQPAETHDPQVDTPSNGLGFLGLMLVGAGLFPTSAQVPITQVVVAPQTGTPGYGDYLVNVIGCRICHGSNLAGGTPSQFGGPPVGPNLTAMVPKWSEADFVRTIRTGTDPTGHKLSDSMPWKQISAFATDDDLKSIYEYLHALQPITKPPQ